MLLLKDEFLLEAWLFFIESRDIKSTPLKNIKRFSVETVFPIARNRLDLPLPVLPVSTVILEPDCMARSSSS